MERGHFLTSSINPFEKATIYARRSDVTINRVRVFTKTNGDEAILTFETPDSGNGIYGFDLVKLIERVPNDVNNDLSTLDVNGVLDGPLGVSGQQALIEVTHVGTGKLGGASPFRVTGDVNGHLTAEPGRNGLFTPSLGESQIVELVVEGDLLGDVRAGSGAIAIVEVDGTLGAPTSPVTVDSRLHMETIRAGAIYADILPGDVGGQKSYLRFLETVTQNSETGDFIGTIDVTELGQFATDDQDGINIRGSFGSASTPSIVMVEEPLGLDPTKIIARIGNFQSPTPGGSNPSDFYSRFELPVNGVVGKVILNPENNGGVWDSDARLIAGSVTLSAADFAEIPSTFGGGVVGTVPYTRHAEWSSPEDGGTITIRQNDPTSIVDPPPCQDLSPTIFVRTYGRVYKSGSGKPLRVQKFVTTMSGPDWEDVPNQSDYTVTMATSAGAASQEISIQKTTGTWTKGDYRVIYDRTLNEQVSGTGNAEILCADTVASGVRMATFTHEFSTYDSCGELLLQMYDLNSDDGLCTLDIGEWAANPVDFNDDATADSADMTILYNAINLYNSLD